MDKEDIKRLAELREEIMDALDEARKILKDNAPKNLYERAKDFWIGHITVGIGGKYGNKYDYTFEDTISDLSDILNKEETEDQKDEWENENYNTFSRECKKAGLDIREYHGRNNYHGPAVETDDLQSVLKATTVNCLWDSFGKSNII